MSDVPGETISDETMYQICRNSETLSLKNLDNKNNFCCCCITYKWWFEHSGIPLFSTYDENKNNYCKCLDCCTWCLEFKMKKPIKCIKDTNCYFCCFVIYFT